MQIVSVPPDELGGSLLPLLGVAAIATELASQGVPADRLFENSGLNATQLADSTARMSLRQRLKLYENAAKYSVRTDTGLRAGARQRISDYGIYGYAMASSATLREAIAFGVNHLSLAGPTMQARYRVESGVAVLSGHSLQMSGPLLVFAVDFWRSSINTLLTRIMESPVPSRLMVFPYLAPPHWREYTQILKCPVEFVEGVMEWHLIESALDQPCPNANPITAQISQALCERMINASAEGNSLVRRIRIECVNSPGQVISAEEMADRLHMSARSMFRHLSAEQTSYQDIVDDVRSKLAIEYLRETLMSTEEVSCRLGFSDASSFRKAFKRWNGMTPSEYRQSIAPSLA